ncbi:MAG: GldM family protein [Bacteroidetes bacterium]|nr:GldM family protein [Bacteroidota bacterium]
MKFITLAVFSLLFSTVYAQKDEKDLVFKIKNDSKIKVTPSTSFILLGKSKTFRITASGANTVTRVAVSGASVETQAGGLYKISTGQSEQILVNVYAKTPGGQEFIAKVLKYQVIPMPTLSVGGVEKDYAITKAKLVSANLSATSHELGKVIQIQSFEVRTDTDTLFSNSSSLTAPMRKYANTLQDGSMMWFYNVKCQFPDGTEEIMPFFRVYVVDSKRRNTF